MIEVFDDRGLVCGFRLHAGAAAVPLDRRESALLPDGRDGGAVWLHFNLTDARARNWLANTPRLRLPRWWSDRDKARLREAVERLEAIARILVGDAGHGNHAGHRPRRAAVAAPGVKDLSSQAGKGAGVRPLSSSI